MAQLLMQTRQVFAFTFRQQVKKKGYLTTLILVAILLFALPVGILGFMAADSGGAGTTGIPESGLEPGSDMQPDVQPGVVGQDPSQPAQTVKEVFVVQLSAGTAQNGEEAGDAGAGAVDGVFSAEALNALDFGEMTGVDLSVTFRSFDGDFEAARDAARGRDDAALLVVDPETATLQLLIPEESRLGPEALADLQTGLDGYLAYLAYGSMPGLGEAGSDGLTGGETAGQGDETQEGEMDRLPEEGAVDEDVETAREILGYVVPYLNIMVLYFFVLFYGQSVAQSVVMEKTSKLMDVFLLSVRPEAMVLGKMTALCLAGLLQIAAWIAALFGGFLGGKLLVQAIAPGTGLPFLEILDALREMGGLVLTPSGLVLGLCFTVVGMLLYCALAGIGGAIASRPEDLSSTNILFTIILVASFLACLLAGGLTGGDGAQWLDWVPFTAIMLVPSHILIGTMSIGKGCLCLAISLAACGLFVWLAGRVYRVMALYQGKLPAPKQIIRMLRQA